MRLSRAVYLLESVKRASYALTARYDVAVSATGKDIRCLVGSARPDLSLDTAERDLRREVIDQDLRVTIEKRIEAYRDTVLGLAFSKTGLQGG